MVNDVPREVPQPKHLGPVGPPLGFWPWDLPKHNNHHDTSSAFSNNIPLYSLQPEDDERDDKSHAWSSQVFSRPWRSQGLL